MLFYARGVPTYVPIYLWTPLFYGKLSPVSPLHAPRSLARCESYSCVCIYLMTSDGVWDGEMDLGSEHA